jgi:hypothetical protein
LFWQQEAWSEKTLHQFADNMLGIGGASTVTAKEYFASRADTVG